MSNQKIEITKYVINQLNLSNDEKSFRRLNKLWWQNIREKNYGGMALTQQGFEALKAADIKHYRIKFEEILNFDNQIILGLDKFINAPFYVTYKDIYVFNETTAIQLILFGGNIRKFIRAKHKNSKLD